MMYEELIKRLRENVLCKYGARISVKRELLAKAADAIEELIAALTASNEVISKQSQQLEEYQKYDSFLAAHGCFDNVEPPNEEK